MPLTTGKLPVDVLAEARTEQHLCAVPPGSPAWLSKRLADIGEAFEGLVAESAKGLISGTQVPFFEISQFGIERALTVLPVEPTFAESTKIVVLIDQIVAGLAEKLLTARQAVPRLVDHCVALSAAFALPGRLHRIIAANRQDAGKEVRDLAKGLQVTEVQARLMYDAYTDPNVDESFTGFVTTLSMNIDDPTQWDWSVQDHAVAFRKLLDNATAVWEVISNNRGVDRAGLEALVMPRFTLTEAPAQVLVGLLMDLETFDPRDVGTFLGDPTREMTAEATHLLQQTTDKEAMVILTPYYLKADGTERPGWTLSLAGLDSRSLDYLESYQHVRAGVGNALSLLKHNGSLALYEDRRQQRPDGEGVTGRAEGNTDFLYLASGEQLEGKCLTCLLIDDWREGFPNMQETTGIAFRYDSPQAEAPHVVLVAVPPRLSDQEEWTTDLLANTLLETIELFKVRMVGSDDIIGSDLGRHLPALLFGPDSEGKALFPSVPRFFFDFDIGSRYHYVPSEQLTASELATPDVTAVRGSGVELDE